MEAICCTPRPPRRLQALVELVWELLGSGSCAALPLPALSPLAPGSREARKKLEEEDEQESDAELLCTDLVQVRESPTARER